MVEEHTEIDLSDIENSEQYHRNDILIEETEDTDLANHSELNITLDIQDEIANSVEPGEKKVTNPSSKNVGIRSKLPMARIKNIMKMDPDANVISAEAIFLVTKATELFLETIAKETYTNTAQHKRKTIAKKDLDVVINKVDCLCFLEGAMDF